MDGSEQSSSNSKVIVQCTDPYDLFDRVEGPLAARSPLHNLHWKATSRPLRSIPNLNVTFVKETTSNGANGSVRRHQIPGLRATPYVKIYLVRCDDKETYKEKVRKEVRAWVKSQTSTDGKSSTKSQEEHDASEWLVLHVVLPNTPAASQPRSTKHISIEASESTDSVNSKSKWTGKSSSTIFDKLRADFSNSKSSPSRVAQIRLIEPGERSPALTSHELEEQWKDLIDSIKQCILKSFDARVAQYEADIRERENQRSLPGWNFCTFFVLKEGLAKGFENLGLLDDAMAVYGELSLGLDSMVEDRGQEGEVDDSGALLSFSKEAKAFLRAAISTDDTGSTGDLDLASSLDGLIEVERPNFPFDVEKRDYSTLILTNQVSAFDLRVYLFSREMQLLGRQAMTSTTKKSEAGSTGGNTDMYAAMLDRAMRFVSLASLTLRFELYQAWGGQDGLSRDELHNQRVVTGNIVSNWQWQALMQTLCHTLPALGKEESAGTDPRALDVLEIAALFDTDSGAGLSMSTADSQRLSLGSAMREPSRERSLERRSRLSTVPNGLGLERPTNLDPARQRMALWLAKVLLMARQTVENLECVKIRMAKVKAESSDTESSSSEMVNGRNGHSATTDGDVFAGLSSTTFKAVASSPEDFNNLMILLSVSAFRLASQANSRYTARSILTHLAEVEQARGKNVLAARYFHGLLGQLPRPTYDPRECRLFRLYADCLSTLDRPAEYARVLISCMHQPEHDRLEPKDSRYLDQLLEVLVDVPSITLPAPCLISISSLAKTVLPTHDKDGFTLSVTLRSVGSRSIPIENIKLRLVAAEGHEPHFIQLTHSRPVSIGTAGTVVKVASPVTIHGWYVADELEMNVGNLRLLHHFKKSEAGERERSEDLADSQSTTHPILVYSSHRSLAVQLLPFPVIDLTQTRRLLLRVRMGENDIEQCRLRLRTATAGLRLNIYEAKSTDDTADGDRMQTAREGDVQLIVFKSQPAGSTTDIEIPYTMEFPAEPSVSLRIEANYETSQGTFTLYDTLSMKVILPVIVNVQDIFRQDYMYAKFAIKPSTMVPLRLINCHLQNAPACDIVDGGNFREAFVVFPKHPASWTVRLRDNKNGNANPEKMTLVVDFQSLDGVILALLEWRFVRDIAQSDYAFAARVLVTHLLEVVRTTWTEQDVELAGLLQEFRIWAMEDMAWSAILCAFDKPMREGLENWLRAWHASTPPISLSDRDVPWKQLRLNVDIPLRPLLVEAYLDLHGRDVVYVGQPVIADLVIRLLSDVESSSEASSELIAPSDTWLMGGWRKGTTNLTREQQRRRVVLFPQLLGHLMLPSVAIKCQQHRQSSNQDEWTDMATEVYNPGHGRTVLVTPGLQETTVEAFGANGDGGIGRLLGSGPLKSPSHV
jgi:trafficking protein particle complex subunit 10